MSGGGGAPRFTRTRRASAHSSNRREGSCKTTQRRVCLDKHTTQPLMHGGAGEADSPEHAAKGRAQGPVRPAQRCSSDKGYVLRTRAPRVKGCDGQVLSPIICAGPGTWYWRSRRTARLAAMPSAYTAASTAANCRLGAGGLRHAQTAAQATAGRHSTAATCAQHEPQLRRMHGSKPVFNQTS